MPRLLLVEDDHALRRTLAISLGARRYEVAEADTGARALELLDSGAPDLVVLDLGLPDMDGLSLIGRIRAGSAVPIIVLSARSLQSHKVDALEAGADDYLTKPFGLEELVARIRVALRRTNTAPTPQLVTTEAFTLDLPARRAMVRGEPVRLTPTEWRLLEVLTRHPGVKVASRDLLREIWGPAAVGQTNYLRVYFSHLRRKLEDDPAHPRHLITLAGEGYRFDP